MEPKMMQNMSESAKVYEFLGRSTLNTYLKNTVKEEVTRLLTSEDSYVNQVESVHTYVNGMIVFASIFEHQANIIKFEPSVQEILNAHLMGSQYGKTYQQINAMLFEEFAEDQKLLDLILHVSENVYGITKKHFIQ